jgi:chemotaxis methyl-accepting protein methylase
MNYLRIKSRPRRVEFTLIDQDERALSCAYAKTYPEVIRLGDEASVNCLHISFSQVMRAGPLFQKLPLQDLVYSVGLVDYLSARRARAFVTDLYDQLAPGGLLIVGNMRDTAHGNLWPLEFISDWSLVYRNAEEMRDLAGGIGPAELELRTDPTGRIYLLRIRKPGRPL